MARYVQENTTWFIPYIGAGVFLFTVGYLIYLFA
jgi:hypothetical protein